MAPQSTTLPVVDNTEEGPPPSSASSANATANSDNDARLQAALRLQLLKTQERVKQELLEQENALRKVKKRQEAVGLELYGMQQQLAGIRSSLDSANEKHLDIVKERTKAEQSIATLKKTAATKKAKVEEVRRSVAKTKAELDALLKTLRQAKKYNEEVKSEMAITRTVASKTGETVRAMAKDKQAQDDYIDGLCEQKRRLEADLSLTGAQLKAQQDQTEGAKDIIQRTNAELEVLILEKKQLVQQWKSSILALNRRDHALAAADKALKKSQARSKDYSGEIQSLQLKLEQAQSDKESLSLKNNRLESEAGYLKRQIETAKSDHASAKVEYEILEKSLVATSAEEEKVHNAIRKLQNEIESINHKIELVTRTRKELEMQIGTSNHEQKTVSRAVMSLMQEEKAVVGNIHDKEIEAANMENQLARLKVDSLNSKSKSSALRELLQAETLKLRNKDGEISQCETDIRQRNEDIEKKMSRIDLLTRKYDKMLDGVDEDEPMGPLEATIKSLTKDVEQEGTESTRLQQEYFAAQTDLVQIMSQADTTQERNTEISARLNIMQQKRLRLIQDIHTNEEEVKSIESRMKGMHSDVIRLNELIAKNTEQQTQLLNSNTITEREFALELKELDKGLAQMDAKIAEIRAAKKNLVNEMVQVERQVLLWEKKIQLEKETHAALRTGNDINEVRGMEKEISRMKLRLAAIKRDQEVMMKEMEKAIEKREDINIKFGYSNSGNGGRST
mmetsp:Transcript_6291/g.13814  ORF Transcript_6291/g.13814 Transcript_6291/m.13814 type:complete len:736 (+) Transcript_6291:2456-4663(+)